MKKTVIALTVLGVASMVAANAAQTQYATPVPGSIYAGVQLGWGHASIQNWNGHKNQFVGGLFAGYQFTNALAVQFGTQAFSKLSNDALNGSLRVTPYLTAALRYDLPLANHFDLFGEAGAGLVYSKTTAANFSRGATRFTPLLEAGLQYAFTPKVAISLADQVLINATNVTVNDVKYRNTENSIFVGLQYNFGSQMSSANLANSEAHMHMKHHYAKGYHATTKENIGVNGNVKLTSGMTVSNINKLAGAQFKNLQGVLVTNVVPGSYAWNLGLRPNDVIVNMNGYKVANMAQLSQIARMPQKATTVTVVRGEAGQVLKLENENFNIGSKALFAYDQFGLSKTGMVTLNTMLDKIKASGIEDPVFIVKGYTGPIGSAKYNLTLSQKRANTVAQYLESQGVPAKDIHAMGYGETHLVVTQAQYNPHNSKGETLIEFLAPNRRVTVAIDGIVARSSVTQQTQNVLGLL